MIQVIASLAINPDEPDALDTYFRVAGTLMEEVGASITQKIELGEAVIGEKASEIVMLVKYPSLDALQQVFNSPEYESLIPIRDKAFVKYNICYVDSNDLLEPPGG